MKIPSFLATLLAKWAAVAPEVKTGKVRTPARERDRIRAARKRQRQARKRNRQ